MWIKHYIQAAPLFVVLQGELCVLLPEESSSNGQLKSLVAKETWKCR